MTDEKLEGDVDAFLNHRAIERATRAAQVRNSPMKDGQKKIRGVNPATTEMQYTQDEVEFMNAMHEYKQRTGRNFPTHSETLKVLHGLGYQKVGKIT